jgi:FkbM family methyltransferase
MVTKFYDPLIEIPIGKYKLKLPLSHPLKENLKYYPDLNWNLPRIIKYAQNFVNDIKVVDIGANIGDTALFIKSMVDVPILCIDGDEKYINILNKNVQKFNDISVVKVLVGGEDKISKLEIKATNGTGSVSESESELQIKTLETILSENPSFQSAKFLKIDTDGYDSVIIRGSEHYLKVNLPILFFEFDPYFISKIDNPFEFFDFVISLGYRYFVFYMNTGDFLLACRSEDNNIIQDLIHYFSGRNLSIFTDICAFSEKDRSIFDYVVEREVEYFRNKRKY